MESRWLCCRICLENLQTLAMSMLTCCCCSRCDTLRCCFWMQLSRCEWSTIGILGCLLRLVWRCRLQTLTFSFLFDFGVLFRRLQIGIKSHSICWRWRDWASVIGAWRWSMRPYTLSFKHTPTKTNPNNTEMARKQRRCVEEEFRNRELNRWCHYVVRGVHSSAGWQCTTDRWFCKLELLVSHSTCFSSSWSHNNRNERWRGPDRGREWAESTLELPSRRQLEPMFRLSGHPCLHSRSDHAKTAKPMLHRHRRLCQTICGVCRCRRWWVGQSGRSRCKLPTKLNILAKLSVWLTCCLSFR